MQHVRSHCGIEGNELVDREADAAAELDQNQVAIHYRDIAAAAKAVLRQERLDATKDINTKRKELLGHENRVNLNKTNHLLRYVERTLSQLRVGFEHKIGTLHRVTKTHGSGKQDPSPPRLLQMVLLPSPC